jgi:hypothetical protein
MGGSFWDNKRARFLIIIHTPMALDQNAIDELKKIHFQEFGEELTNEEAWDMGISLLRLFKTLSRKCSPSEKNGADNLTGERKILYD